METTPSATPAQSNQANGLMTYLQVITSPTAAFDQLKRTPMWGWAAVATIALFIVATCISMPEIIKVAHIAQQQQLATMSADQQAAARQGMAATQGLIPVFGIVGVLIVTWIVWLVAAVVYTAGGAMSGAGARFSLAWVVSVNVSAIAAVGALVNGIILALRGPDSIATTLDQYTLPSLGMLVHGNVKLIAFLNAYNIDYVWLYIVAALGLERTLSMSRPASITTVVILSLLFGGLAAAFAK